ncbi:MAG: hypothetical protein JWR19_4447 [Pedosphaera sp.]|nr:hypothetical protein [Pedosphaera sp.]
MNQLETFLRIAGFLHFGILVASASTPHALNWRQNLASLHPFLRKLFWVYGIFIVLVIIAFGVLTLRHTADMAAGVPLGRSLCIFIGIFWLARLLVQLFVFDARPFLTNWFYKLGYHVLTVVFVYFVVVYWMAALMGKG